LLTNPAAEVSTWVAVAAFSKRRPAPLVCDGGRLRRGSGLAKACNTRPPLRRGRPVLRPWELSTTLVH
jgi:hypothetical protein